MRKFHEYVQAAIKVADGVGYVGSTRKHFIYAFVISCFNGGLSE